MKCTLRDRRGRFIKQIKRAFPLFTNGQLPEIDRLAIVIQCISEMHGAELQATLGYIGSRFGK